MINLINNINSNASDWIINVRKYILILLCSNSRNKYLIYYYYNYQYIYIFFIENDR